MAKQAARKTESRAQTGRQASIKQKAENAAHLVRQQGKLKAGNPQLHAPDKKNEKLFIRNKI